MHKRNVVIGLAILMNILAITGCNLTEASPQATPMDEAEVANPASTYCLEQGYRWEMRTTDDGEQHGVCIFSDGSECEEWAFYRSECAPSEPTPTDIPSPEAQPGREVTYEGVRFIYDESLAAEVMGEIVPSEGFMGDVIPEHRAFSFNGYTLAGEFPQPEDSWNGRFLQPRIYIYPVDEFQANSKTAASAIEAVGNISSSDQSPPSGISIDGAAMPFLPLYNARELLHVQMTSLNFQNGRGVRFLTQYSQTDAPIYNKELFYTFQGLTSDEQFYVAAVFPVSHLALPDEWEALGSDLDDFAYNTYLRDMVQQIDMYKPDSFAPDLLLLDALITSIEVMP